MKGCLLVYIRVKGAVLVSNIHKKIYKRYYIEIVQHGLLKKCAKYYALLFTSVNSTFTLTPTGKHCIKVVEDMFMS